MRKFKIKYTFLLIAVVATPFFVNAKLLPNNSVQCLQINKSVYVSGETIWFKNSLVSNNNDRQNILFADLCGEGTIISSRILLRENKHWEGEISIPDSLETGIYLLRTYTGNYDGMPELTSKLITVINKFGNNKTNEERKQFLENRALDQSIQIPEKSGFGLKTYAQSSKYAPKDIIQFSIEKDGNNFLSGVSFSVYKISDNKSDSSVNISNPERLVEYAQNNKTKIYNDLTLSGKVITKETKIPVADEFVLFSVPDSIPQIIYSKTDKKGEFQFHLEDSYGLKDAVIQTISKASDYEIILFQDLLDPPVRIPFYIPEETEKSDFANLAIQRAILHKAYNKEALKIEIKHSSEYPFYGRTSEVTIPDDYFDLNDFEEIAKEILPLCKVRKVKDDYSIRIYNPEKMGNFDNPWILVDGIPVYEVKDLLPLNSSRIKRIETQPEIRCYGDLFIEGVLSIFTYRNQFDEVSLPKNAIRTQIETFYQPSDYSGNFIIKDNDFADFRDVLYWQPIIESVSNLSKIGVQCSYEKGNYIAVAQSVDASGDIHLSVFEFKVE